MSEILHTRDGASGGMRATSDAGETAHTGGHYSIRCTGTDGELLWADEVDNLVVTVGQNQILAAALQGSAYSVTGPYMFLISSVGFSTIVAADTMASHAGWNEASSTDAPSYGATRPTATFATPASGSITTTGTIDFVFTNSGTVQGIGMTFGSGATNTVGSTTGVLLSAGTLTTPQPVISGNTVTATWTLGL